MNSSLIIRRTIRLGFLALAFSLVCAINAAERKMEARLIWGTNEDKSPDPKHKLLDGELAKKLHQMPLKWKNFFEVNRQVFTITDTNYTKVVMSKKCSIEVKDKSAESADKVTVKLYGEGTSTPVRRVDKSLPKGEVLTIGGDAKDNNAWFITVRPVNVEPKTAAPAKDPVIAKPAAPAK